MVLIWDLDGTLACCEHRRHFIKPENYPDLCRYSNYRMINGEPILDRNGKASWRYKETGEPFQHGFTSFFEACDLDTPIQPVIYILEKLSAYHEIEIWSGRCESVRKKTEEWLSKFVHPFYKIDILKMRPIGDYTPDDVLKEQWLDEALAEGKTIEYIFDDRKKVRDMWVRRGIFVFDVSQGKGDF